MIRKADKNDIAAIGCIYELIHDEEAAGRTTIGWERGVYPTEQTAADSVERGDMYVMEVEGRIVGTAIINQIQVPCYYDCDKWEKEASDEEVLVLHTLVIDPGEARKGYGREFVEFYTDTAREMGCTALRMDTNERNKPARAMYRKLGFTEPAIIPTVFNGIPGVNLVLLEKVL